MIDISDMSTEDRTVGDLINYLDDLIQTIPSKKGAVRHLKTAVIKVTQTLQGHGWRNIKLNEININNYMRQFSNATKGQYNDASLATYRQRIEKVFKWYKIHLNDPSWRPYPDSLYMPITDKGSSAESGKATNPVLAIGSLSSYANNDLVTYPFPLSDGRLIQINLPLQLSKSDAERINNFVRSIATDTYQNPPANTEANM